MSDLRLLSRYAYLAVAAALVTIALKTLAWQLDRTPDTEDTKPHTETRGRAA